MRKILRGHVFIKIFLFTLCLGSSFLFEVHAQVSGTFTINSGAAPSATNFQSFSAAAAFLSGGVNGAVTFNVAPGSGPYYEQVIFNAIPGTSASNTITFNCNGEVLSFLSMDPWERAGVKLNDADYITFDNLKVEMQGSDWDYGYGFHLLNNADNNTIRNCHITSFFSFFFPMNYAGIVINGNTEEVEFPGTSNCDNNLVQGNTIIGGNVGIALSSIPVFNTPVVYMSGNRIINNKITDFALYGIQLNYNDGTLVEGNEITGLQNLMISAGISIGYSNQGLVVSKNRIHDFIIPGWASGNNITGILINSEGVAGKENLIANNLIYNFQSTEYQYGIAVKGALVSTHFKIYNNTISFDDQTLQGTETFGLFFEYFDEFDIKNNIITISREVTNWNYGIYVAHRPNFFRSEHNDVYIPDLPGTFYCHFGYLDGNEVTTLTEWRSTTDNDHFSTDVNPVYTNLAAFNFKPTSRAIDNMGVHVGLTTDLDNATRKLTYPDPGCYEFTSASCTLPVVPGNAFSPDTVMCIGPRVEIGVRGQSTGDGQKYVWQTSTSETGPWSDLTPAYDFPYYEGAPVTTLYYRVAATCAGSTANSVPVRIVVTAALNSGTYTINSAQPTGGINFTSFSDAARALQCGINGHVIFNVAANNGPYKEQMIIPVINTAPDRTVTFMGNGATIAYEPRSSHESAVIKLDGADYITIDSLNVEVLGDTMGYGFGIQLINDADHNTIKRNTIKVSKTATDDTYAGVVINGVNDVAKNEEEESYCDSNLVDRNTVIGGFFGIICVSKSDVLSAGLFSDGNIFSRNICSDNCGYGIYASGLNHVIIDSNDISHPTRTIFPTSGFGGIWINRANTAVTITRNRIHNIFEKSREGGLQVNGIRMDAVKTDPDKPHLVSNNAVYFIRGNGLQHGLYAFDPDHVKFYHNTVSLEDSASKPTAPTRGFAMFGTWGTDIEFKNNSIVINRGGQHPKYGIYLNSIDNVSKINYNNIYVRSNGTGAAYTGYMNTQDFPTLTSWLLTGKDSNSIAMDPVYHDIALGDLTPTKIPFDNRGTNVSVSKDIWDTARSITTPDIGAFEFTICRQLSNPVLTADSVGVNAIRFSWPAIQHTTGYRVSRDGINWAIPSSGAMGLTHTVAGLKPGDTVGLMVKALGARIDCPEYFSQRVIDTALADGIYVPNTFTPNGNGQNDVFKVYSNVIKSVRWMVFNQWGEKVFETADLQGAWDGMYKGKPQPIGVYVFVVSGTLSDGTKVTQKGTFNLIR